MATEGGDGRYGLRKRRRTDDAEEPSGLDRLLSAAETASRVVVFSGSGLSATSGMSTFSTRGGLYERAQRQFRLGDGKLLFTYSFFDRNRMDAQSFFADIYLEAAQARAAPGHRALAALHRAGRLRRHYTLNIDGLAEKVGMDTWHPETNPDGCTVEMHGNVHHLVCTECGGCCPLSEAAAQQLRQRQPIPCPVCPPVPPLGQEAEDDAEAVAEGAAAEIGGSGAGEATPPPLRFKVMLYEDAEGEYITPEEVMDLMEEDAKAADLILWVGISFQQSASTAYFRKVRHWIQEAGRSEHVTQVVINPSDEALWNLMTACSNQQELNVVEVLATSDDALPAVVARVAEADRKAGRHPVRMEDAAAMWAAAARAAATATAPAPASPPASAVKEEEDASAAAANDIEATVAPEALQGGGGGGGGVQDGGASAAPGEVVATGAEAAQPF